MADNFDLENKGIANFPQYEGIPVAISSFLPYRQRFELCEIATRKRHFIEGEWIHVIYISGKFYCSKWFFEELLKQNGINDKEKTSANFY